MNNQHINISNEAEYIDLMNDLKEKYDAFQKEKIILNNQILDYKKSLITVYGIIRLTDEIIEGIDMPSFLKDLISSIRTYLSNEIELILE